MANKVCSACLAPVLAAGANENDVKILSFQCGYHDASAAVLDGYDILAAVSQERMTRKKGDGSAIPFEAVDEVLSIAGVTRDQIDVVACNRGLFPYTLFHGLPLHKRLQYGWQSRGKQPRTANLETQLIRAGTLEHDAIFNAAALMDVLGFARGTPLHVYNHHKAHALSALFHIMGDNVLAYTGDGRGDGIYYSMYHLSGGALHELYGGDVELLKPTPIDSVGQAYAAMTQALGYRPNRHEGKLTGLAAYGKPTLLNDMQARFSVDADGRISSTFPDYKAMWRYMEQAAKTVTPEDAACSIQQLLERTVRDSVKALLERTGANRLALAGGIFANVRLNQLLAELPGVEETFIFPAMADDGITIGGAYDVLLERDGIAAWLAARRKVDTMYMGRDHRATADEVLGAGPGVITETDRTVDRAAELCAQGYVGAIYTGRMEFGPRALGARTILASPANTGLNDSLNARLQRTEFMPFAPVVLEEHAEEVFEIDDRNRYACRFMTITTGVREHWREKIPAVVHVDNTARPQIVTDADNPLYAAIIRAFGEKTGLLAMVNTSFNAHEEPIINSPAECLRALVDDRVDFVITDKALYRVRPLDGQAA